MREIKIRAWDEGNKRLFKVARFDFADYTVYSHLFECEGYLSENLKIMQYTGLVDKNGAEIYEGDILLIQADGYDPIISEVVWGGTEYPAFDLPEYDGYGMNSFSAIYLNDVEETLEVIGNIYEHNHLLGDNNADD